MSFVLGQEMEFKGLITRSFSVRSGNISSITNGDVSFDVFSSDYVQVGSIACVFGVLEEHQGKPQLKSKKIETITGEEAAKLSNEILSKAEAKVSLSAPDLLVSDTVTQKMSSLFQTAARKILFAKSLNRFVFLRFHGDADGISGALALTKICKMQAFQQNSAVYSVAEAMRDLQLVHHEFMPLIILSDFCSGSESEEGLKLLKAGGAEVVIIDHHPPTQNIAKTASLFVNPWSLGLDSEVSKYPAGYMCVEISRIAGVNGIEPLANVSCAGDKSNILKVEDSDRDKALVLDYMASYAGFGNSLDFYSSVMGKPELFTSMLFQAKEKIEQIYETVHKTLREKEINGIKVAIIDLERISKKHEFPSKGKIATRVFESINSDKPLVVLGYSDRSVIFRINEPAVSRGIAADQLIIELKSTMKDFIESGGGHAKAAALRVKEEFAKDVIEEIVKVITKSGR